MSETNAIPAEEQPSPTGEPSGPAEAPLGSSGEWSARATATVVDNVDKVRSLTTGKALVASRLAVYFIAAGLVAVIAGILFLVLLVRLMVLITNELPFLSGGQVWFTYLILGLVFMLMGWFLWRKRGR